MGAGIALCAWAAGGIAQPSAYVVDGDADGVADEVDRCLYSRPGERVDRMGCAATDDADYDGIPDEYDFCPNTPDGTAVDAFGCEPQAAEPATDPAQTANADADADGVIDQLDQCPYSEAGAWVDAQGCALDADLDGVADGRDYCPDSPYGRPVDGDGCARGDRRLGLPTRPPVAPVASAGRAEAVQPDPAPDVEPVSPPGNTAAVPEVQSPPFVTAPASTAGPVAAPRAISAPVTAAVAPALLSSQDKLDRLLSAISGATAAPVAAAAEPVPVAALSQSPPMAAASAPEPSQAGAAAAPVAADVYLTAADASLQVSDLASAAEVAAWRQTLQSGAQFQVPAPVVETLSQAAAAPPIMAAELPETVAVERRAAAPAQAALVPPVETSSPGAPAAVTAPAQPPPPAVVDPPPEPPPVLVAEIPDLPVRVVPQPQPIAPIPVEKLSRDLRFVRGSVELDGAIMAKLRERLPDWERALAQHRSNQLMLIGSQRDDREITSTRSQVVRAFLMAMGIAPQRISMERGVVNDANLRIEVGGSLE